MLCDLADSLGIFLCGGREIRNSPRLEKALTRCRGRSGVLASRVKTFAVFALIIVRANFALPQDSSRQLTGERVTFPYEHNTGFDDERTEHSLGGGSGRRFIG